MDIQKVARDLETVPLKDRIIREACQDPEKALAIFQSMEHVIDIRVQYRVQQLQAQMNAVTSDFLLVEVKVMAEPDGLNYSVYPTFKATMLRKSDISAVESGESGVSIITFQGEKLATITPFADIQAALGYKVTPPL